MVNSSSQLSKLPERTCFSCHFLFIGLYLDRSGADGHFCPGLHARPQQGGVESRMEPGCINGIKWGVPNIGGTPKWMVYSRKSY